MSSLISSRTARNRQYRKVSNSSRTQLEHLATTAETIGTSQTSATDGRPATARKP